MSNVWKSTKKELPKLNERVLLVFPHGQLDIGHLSTDIYKEETVGYKDEQIISYWVRERDNSIHGLNNVTFWCPLPEEPKKVLHFCKAEDEIDEFHCFERPNGELFLKAQGRYECEVTYCPFCGYHKEKS